MAHPSVLELVLVAAVAPALGAAAAVDLRERRIPNALTGGAAGALVAVRLTAGPGTLAGAAAWAVTLAVPLAAVAWAAPGGLGMGDAKLAGVLGLALGPAAVIAVLAGLAVAGLAGGCLVAARGLATARRATLPLAPFLAAGAALTVPLTWGAGGA